MGVKAFSPGHVTGLFYIADMAENPLDRGSFGAGFSLSDGVTTKTSFNNSFTGSRIFINGQKKDDARVSEGVIELYKKKYQAAPNKGLLVEHTISVPPSSGFGSSGAGALSLALALNELYECSLSYDEAAQIAHIAEVECRTGLGTVIGETRGGFEIRTKAGAPGIGTIETYPYDPSLKGIFWNFGGRDTSSLLADEKVRQNINRYGKKLLEQLMEKRDYKTFLETSREFAEKTGLINNRLREIINKLDAIGVVSSILMFGEVVFTLIPENEIDLLGELITYYRRKGNIFISTIADEGGRVL